MKQLRLSMLDGRAVGLMAALSLPATALGGTLTVGPGKTYAKPCQAIAAAAAGDVIEIDASGSYGGDTCAWSTDNLTVRGVGGRPKLDIAGVPPAQKKGLFTIAAPNATIENLEFSGAAISAADGNNGAGIRHQGLNLTVRGCYFHDNQNGILGAPSTAGMGRVVIEGSEFSHNGAGDGYSHNMYIGNYAGFTLRYSYSHRGNVGHLVKSRAYQNQILSNRITDESSGTASYEIDLPNGGTSLVIGNIIEQSATTQNPSMLAYGEEGTTGYDTHLYVVNNTFLNDRKSGTFVNNATTTPGVLTNNIFHEAGTVSSQAAAVMTSNFVSATLGDPMFVSAANFDVHLQAGSPCIDKGTAPGSGSGQPLTPQTQYVQPASSESRGVGGSAIDTGAYEYANPGSGGGQNDGGSGAPGDGGSGSPTDGGSMAGGCSYERAASAAAQVPMGSIAVLGGLLILLARRRSRLPAPPAP